MGTSHTRAGGRSRDFEPFPRYIKAPCQQCRALYWSVRKWGNMGFSIRSCRRLGLSDDRRGKGSSAFHSKLRVNGRSTSPRQSSDHVKRIQGEFLDWAFQDCASMMAVSWEALDFRKLTASRWPKVYRLCHSVPIRFHCCCIIRPGSDRTKGYSYRKGV